MCIKRKKIKPIIVKRELPNTPLMKELNQADILLFRWKGPRDFLGGSIGYFTNSPYSHAEVYLSNGFALSAGSHGVGYEDLLKASGDIDVFRYENLTREQRLIIQAKAQQSLLHPYGFANLILFPFAGKRLIARWTKNNAYICSEVTAWVYKEAGIDLVPGKLEAIEAPADLARSKELSYKGTFHLPTGNKISDNSRFKCLSYQTYSKKVIRIGNIIKFLSKRDEGYNHG